MKVSSQALARSLRKARELLGETQSQFAARVGVNQATVSRWEIAGPQTGPSRIAVERILEDIGRVISVRQ